MTDNNFYQLQQDKLQVNSSVPQPHHPIVIKQDHLANDLIEESVSLCRKSNVTKQSKSPPLEQQKTTNCLNSPNERLQNFSNNLYQERFISSEISTPEIHSLEHPVGNNGGGNSCGWNDADEDSDRNSPGASSTLFLNNTNQPRISSSPLPPPPPAHSYPRLSVPLQQNRNRVSPTNWHQPQNQLDYIQQQQQHNFMVSDDVLQAKAFNQQAPSNAFGLLKHENDILYITENCIEIGRNSSTSHVHFHVARNSFVSRKHFQVLYDPETCDFYVACLSKNGIFVDDIFQRRYAEPMKLPKSCSFRFPSTEIKILFESLIASTSPMDTNTTNLVTNSPVRYSSPKTQYSDRRALVGPSMEGTNVVYSPLKISIPKTEQKSPYPSPTGTISAANSCPTSPRQGFQDYQNYNSYNNNNLQSSQELFQTPATSNYNDHEKPPYSYAQLIVQSISAAPEKQLTLSGIYSFISKHYPYYRKEANKGWQNSIRHNLSLNRYFIKVARSQDEPGKGSFWRIDPTSEAKLIDQSYKKRRQRGSQCYRPSYGMPRSAPVSPSHIDNSRESSPLHDIVLQSAPGSPGISYQGQLDNQSSEDLMYNSQNVIHSSSFSTHSQYNSSPYHLSSGGQQQPIIVSTSGQMNNGSSGNTSAGASFIAIKRHHPITITSVQQENTSGTAQHQGSYKDHEHNTITGATVGNGDECDSAKRPKYNHEINQ